MNSYLSLGGKTLEELPRIPTNIVATPDFSTQVTTITWTNNNTLTGCTNKIQIWDTNNQIWLNVGEVASGESSYAVSGYGMNTYYNIRVAVYNTGTTRYYPSHAVRTLLMVNYPTENLLAKWSFDGDNLVDVSGNGRDLSVGLDFGDTLSYDTGIIGRCASGTGRISLYTADSTILNQLAGTNTYTIAGWFKIRNDFYDGRTALNQWNWLWGEDNFGIGWRFNGSYFLRINKRNQGNDENVDVTTILGGQFQTYTWYHIAQTYDGTDIKTYLNGQLLHTVNAPSDSLDLKDYFIIMDVNFEDANVDEFYVYSDAKDLTTIQSLYNLGV